MDPRVTILLLGVAWILTIGAVMIYFAGGGV